MSKSSKNSVGNGNTADPLNPQSIFALSDLEGPDFPDRIYLPPPPPPRAFVHTTVTGVSMELIQSNPLIHGSNSARVATTVSSMQKSYKGRNRNGKVALRP